MANFKSLAQLYRLWKLLGDVPTRVPPRGPVLIDAPFEHFAQGTPVEDIWHWFEAQNSGFSVGKAQAGELFALKSAPDKLQVLEVNMLDVLPPYDNPDGIPSWEWVREHARFAHVGNGKEAGVYEFMVHAATVLDSPDTFDSLLDELVPVFVHAQKVGAVWVMFHQG